MKRTMEFRETPGLHNAPILDAQSISVPGVENRTTNTALLACLLYNSPRLNIAEVLVINVNVINVRP